MTFSHDGNRLAAAATYLGELHVWDLNTRTRVAVLKLGGAVVVDFSNDGRTLVAVGLPVRFWNIPTFQEIGTIVGDGISVWALGFLPDDLGLVVSYGRVHKCVSLWLAPS